MALNFHIVADEPCDATAHWQDACFDYLRALLNPPADNRYVREKAAEVMHAAYVMRGHP